MPIYGIVETQSNIIVNIIIAKDEGLAEIISDSGASIIMLDDKDAGIGWVVNDGKFYPPVVVNTSP